MPKRHVSLRQAFTLVELLVAMTISLIMVYAMVEIFRTIGSSTSDGRAVIDMQGQLKTAKALLHNDLRGLTVPGTTWPSADAGNGYIYYDEGPMANRLGAVSVSLPSPTPDNAFFANDVVPVYRIFNPLPGAGNASDRFLDFRCILDDGQLGRGPWDNVSLTQTGGNNPHDLEAIDINAPAGNAGERNFNNTPHWRHAFGDVNDVLMFTVRSTSVPFRGRYNGGIIESQLAEVIWWTQLNENPSTQNGVWDIGESFSLRRRVLLIRPDLNVSLSAATTATVLPDIYGNPFAFAGALDPMMAKLRFLHDNDVSVRVAGTQVNNNGQFVAQPLRERTSFPTASGDSYYLAANSLNDLAQRHNRSLFDPFPITVAGGQVTVSPLLFHMDDDTLELAGFEAGGDMVGEDVVIRKVVGFDVRGFDPYAPIFQYNYGGTVVRVQPGDEAFAKVAVDAINATTGPVGYGAYVDLGWGQTLRHTAASNLLLGINSNAAWPTVKTPLEIRTQRDVLNLAAAAPTPLDPQYCTSYFMRPSLNVLPRGTALSQAIIGAPDNPLLMQYPSTGTFVYNTNAYDTWTLAYESDGINQDQDAGVDEGRDGLVNAGVIRTKDTILERETSPPYDRQLRGIEVRIRMYDADTRQIRQTTVIGDLSDLH